MHRPLPSLRRCSAEVLLATLSHHNIKDPVRPWMYRGWRHRLRRSGWLDRTAVHRCVPRLARPGTRVGVGFSNISCKPCSFCLCFSQLIAFDTGAAVAVALPSWSEAQAHTTSQPRPVSGRAEGAPRSGSSQRSCSRSRACASVSHCACG